MTSIYLASGSPRRQELLTQLGVSFERIVTGIEEKRAEGESAQQYVSRLAREKAQAGVALVPRDLPVLGADTIVILNGEVLEKPHDAEHAARMLRKMSGQTHQVMTAVALADSQNVLDCLVVTEVTFRPLSEKDIEVTQYNLKKHFGISYKTSKKYYELLEIAKKNIKNISIEEHKTLDESIELDDEKICIYEFEKFLLKQQ